jgi:hypothetical protein
MLYDQIKQNKIAGIRSIMGMKNKPMDLSGSKPVGGSIDLTGSKATGKAQSSLLQKLGAPPPSPSTQSSGTQPQMKQQGNLSSQLPVKQNMFSMASERQPQWGPQNKPFGTQKPLGVPGPNEPAGWQQPARNQNSKLSDAFNLLKDSGIGGMF